MVSNPISVLKNVQASQGEQLSLHEGSAGKMFLVHLSIYVYMVLSQANCVFLDTVESRY